MPPPPRRRPGPSGKPGAGRGGAPMGRAGGGRGGGERSGDRGRGGGGGGDDGRGRASGRSGDDRPPRGGRSGADRSSRGTGGRSGDERPNRPGTGGRPQGGRPHSGGRSGDGRGRPGGRDGEERSRSGEDRRSGVDRARAERKAVPPPSGRGAAWGGLARRAAGQGGTAAPQEPNPKGRLADAGPSRAAEAFGAAAGRRAEEGEVVEVRRELVEGDPVRRAAGGAVRRGRTAVPEASGEPSKRTRRVPEALTAELAPVVGGTAAPKFAARLADAGRAFAGDRFPEARKILAPLARQAPTSAAVRELLGLTLYRLGKYADAAKELEAFRELTGSTEQHPVLADCYRGLGRYEQVEDLWRELREVSPSAELVAEGRIVYAGSLADRGKLAEAIAEVEPSVRRVKRPREHHLRLLYVLGDLHERAGDVPRARLLFDRVLAADPAFGDAAARRRALS